MRPVARHFKGHNMIKALIYIINALGYEPSGRRFESSRVRHIINDLDARLYVCTAYLRDSLRDKYHFIFKAPASDGVKLLSPLLLSINKINKTIKLYSYCVGSGVFRNVLFM